MVIKALFAYLSFTLKNRITKDNYYKIICSNWSTSTYINEAFFILTNVHAAQQIQMSFSFIQISWYRSTEGYGMHRSVCIVACCNRCLCSILCLSNYCCVFTVSQHGSIWPLWLTTTMKGQITDSFPRDWQHLSPSIFITFSHTLCYTPSLCLAIPFLLLYKAVTH